MHIDDNTIVEQTQSAPAVNEDGEQGNLENSELSGAEAEEEGLSDEEKASRKKQRLQQRFDELTRARREAERRAAFAEEQLAQQRKVAPDLGEKPKLEDFDFDQEAYLDALADYKLKQRLAESETSRAEEARIEQERREAIEFRTREHSVRAEYPDYDQVVYSPNTPITDTMASAIRKDDNGALVAYFLGKNPDIAYKIARAPAHVQYQAIGDLSDKISEYRQTNGNGDQTAAPNATKPLVSSAPPPPPTIQSRGASGSKPPEKMTTEEWMEWRNKQARRKR